jgi:hypothetical protein
MPKSLHPPLDAESKSDSDSSEDGDFVPSGSGRCDLSGALNAALVFLFRWWLLFPVFLNCFFSGSDSEAPDSDISDGEVKKVSADAGDVVQLAASAAGRRATRAAGAVCASACENL